MKVSEHIIVRYYCKQEKFDIAEDLLKQFLHKVENALLYGLQLDESTGVGSKIQLLVYV